MVHQHGMVFDEDQAQNLFSERSEKSKIIFFAIIEI
jgi:hypothetical protein